MLVQPSDLLVQRPRTAGDIIITTCDTKCVESRQVGLSSKNFNASKKGKGSFFLLPRGTEESSHLRTDVTEAAAWNLPGILL